MPKRGAPQRGYQRRMDRLPPLRRAQPARNPAYNPDKARLYSAPFGNTYPNLDRAGVVSNLRPMGKNNNFTPQGLKYLRNVTNLFPDGAAPSGSPYPDTFSGVSFTDDHEAIVDYNFGTTQTTDMCVCLLPITHTSVAMDADYTSSGGIFELTAATTSHGEVGPCTTIVTKAGTPFFPTGTQSWDASTAMASISVDGEHADAIYTKMRTIAKGFEINITTSNDNCAAKVTSFGFDGTTEAVNELTSGASFSTVPCWPYDPSNCGKISTTWPALDKDDGGALCMNKLNNTTVPFVTDSQSSVIIVDGPIKSMGSGSCIVLTDQSGTSNFQVQGVVLTGLVAGDHVRVTYRETTEYMCCQSAANWFRGSATTIYDPFTLSVLDELCSHLPPAVPISWNATGEWWKTIVRIARSIGAALPNIASAVDTVFPQFGGIATKIFNGARPVLEAVDRLVPRY